MVDLGCGDSVVIITEISGWTMIMDRLFGIYQQQLAESAQ